MAYQIDGLELARVALAYTHSHDGQAYPARQWAEAKWGVASPAAMILRATTTAGATSGDGAALSYAQQAGASFIEAVKPRTVLGRMATRRAPLNAKVPAVTTATQARWIGELKVIGISPFSLEALTVPICKLATIAVASREYAKFADPSAEMFIRADLIAAAVEATDRALLSSDVGVANQSPAGLGYNAATVTCTGKTVATITADLELMLRTLDAAGSPFTAPVWIMSPRNAIQLSLLRGTTGGPVFPEMTAQGGMLAGIPVLTSASAVASGGDSPDNGTVWLVDANALVVAEDPGGTTLDLAQSASLQMEETPNSPPSANSVQVSMWQNNLAGWRITRAISWVLARDYVVKLEGVGW